MSNWTTLFESCIDMYMSVHFMFFGIVCYIHPSYLVIFITIFIIIVVWYMINLNLFIQLTDNGLNLYANNIRFDPGHYNRSNYLLAEFPFGSKLPELVFAFCSWFFLYYFLWVERGQRQANFLIFY